MLKKIFFRCVVFYKQGNGSYSFLYFPPVVALAYTQHELRPLLLSVHFMSNVVIWKLVSELWFSMVVAYFGCFDKKNITRMVAYFHYRKNRFCFRGLLFSHFPLFLTSHGCFSCLELLELLLIFSSFFQKTLVNCLFFLTDWSVSKKLLIEVAYRMNCVYLLPNLNDLWCAFVDVRALIETVQWCRSFILDTVSLIIHRYRLGTSALPLKNTRKKS